MKRNIGISRRHGLKTRLYDTRNQVFHLRGDSWLVCCPCFGQYWCTLLSTFDWLVYLTCMLYSWVWFWSLIWLLDIHNSYIHHQLLVYNYHVFLYFRICFLVSIVYWSIILVPSTCLVETSLGLRGLLSYGIFSINNMTLGSRLTFHKLCFSFKKEVILGFYFLVVFLLKINKNK